MSRGRTCRETPASSVWPGPGLGSTSPQVPSDPRPELGEGPADVVVVSVGRGGIVGRASEPRATRVRRTSSVLDQNRQVPR